MHFENCFPVWDKLSARAEGHASVRRRGKLQRALSAQKRSALRLYPLRGRAGHMPALLFSERAGRASLPGGASSYPIPTGSPALRDSDLIKKAHPRQAFVGGAPLLYFTCSPCRGRRQGGSAHGRWSPHRRSGTRRQSYVPQSPFTQVFCRRYSCAVRFGR